MGDISNKQCHQELASLSYQYGNSLLNPYCYRHALDDIHIQWSYTHEGVKQTRPHEVPAETVRRGHGVLWSIPEHDVGYDPKWH